MLLRPFLTAITHIFGTKSAICHVVRVVMNSCTSTSHNQLFTTATSDKPHLRFPLRGDGVAAFNYYWRSNQRSDDRRREKWGGSGRPSRPASDGHDVSIHNVQYAAQLLIGASLSEPHIIASLH